MTHAKITAENEHARISETGGVITVTFDRQGKLNAISPLMTDLLWQATEALAERDDLRVLVITAVGRYFSAGHDIATGPSDRNGRFLPDEQTSRWRRAYRGHHLLYDELESIEKPVVLAAQGPCLGGAFEMACSCDVRLGSETSMWGLPEVRMGLIPGSGGVSRLTRLVGPHWSKWIAMLDRRVDAETARMIGLVHEVYPVDGFPERVAEFAASLTELPPEVVGVAKLTIDACVDLPRDSGRHVERLVNTPLPIDEAGLAYSARFKAAGDTS